MNKSQIDAIRQEAGRVYDRLNTPGTTTYAVAHARDPHVDVGSTENDDDIVTRFQTILPKQSDAFEQAVEHFQEGI